MHIIDIILAYFVPKPYLWHFCWWWAISDFERVASVSPVLGFCAQKVFVSYLLIYYL